jgi:hypothetical protein
MKQIAVAAIAGGVSYYLLYQFVIKTSEEDPTGFVQLSEGFGLDDIVLGGGTCILGAMLARMVR